MLKPSNPLEKQMTHDLKKTTWPYWVPNTSNKSVQSNWIHSLSFSQDLLCLDVSPSRCAFVFAHYFVHTFTCFVVVQRQFTLRGLLRFVFYSSIVPVAVQLNSIPRDLIHDDHRPGCAFLWMAVSPIPSHMTYPSNYERQRIGKIFISRFNSEHYKFITQCETILCTFSYPRTTK